jgi:hypothetical protein
MPGSVLNAAPSAVLPQSLCGAFAHSHSCPVIENEYRNGESQRAALATSSGKQWRLAKRLTAAQLQSLQDFYDARQGPEEPFYFYDPYETSPRFSHDPTGHAAAGRHTVRFASAWAETRFLPRTEVTIELVELA